MNTNFLVKPRPQPDVKTHAHAHAQPRPLHWRLHRHHRLCQKGAHSIYNCRQLLSLGSEIYLGNLRHFFEFSRHKNFNFRQRSMHYRFTYLLLVIFIFTSITRKEVHTFFTVQSDFVVYVVTTLILPENQRQSTSFSMNAANLFLSTTAPNKLIDSQHHKRLRRKIPIAFLSHFTLRTKQLNLSFLNLSFRQ